MQNDSTSNAAENLTSTPNQPTGCSTIQKSAMPPLPRIVSRDDWEGIVLSQESLTAWIVAPTDVVWLGLGPQGHISQLVWGRGSFFEPGDLTALCEKQPFQPFGFSCRDGSSQWVMAASDLLAGNNSFGIRTDNGELKLFNYSDVVFLMFPCLPDDATGPVTNSPTATGG